MSKKQLSVTLNKFVLDKFRKYCKENDINMSKRVERLIRGELEKDE